MTINVIKIERVSPRGGIVEEPEWSAKGYCLGDPKFGAKKHHAKNAIFVKTLDEAAELISKGFFTANGRKRATGFIGFAERPESRSRLGVKSTFETRVFPFVGFI